MSEVRGSRAPDGSRVRLVIDRPRGNILTIDVTSALRAMVADIRDEGPLKLLTIEGAGDDFSFGASIEEHAPERIRTALPAAHDLLRELLRVPVTTAAIVRGRCLGAGFELALACDFIFAAEDATFGLPEIRLGVFPPAAAALLPARVGASRAVDAILSGQARNAQHWADAGLIVLMARADRLEAEVRRWTDEHLHPRSAEALRNAALASRMVLRQLAEPALAEAERLYLDRAALTDDAREGVAAFLEKRPAKWTDA